MVNNLSKLIKIKLIVYKLSPHHICKQCSLQCNLLHLFIFGCLAASEITTLESLQFDFGTIEAATNKFSDDNMIGEGGFGKVYKVRRINIIFTISNIENEYEMEN